METITLVDGHPAIRPAHRPLPPLPRSHRRTPARSTRTATATVGDGRAPTAAPSDRTHEGRVYRPTYIPPSLHVALIGLYLLTLLSGFAAGVGLAHLLG